MHTDPRLKEAAARDPESEVQVVVGCDGYTESTKSLLLAAGLKIENEGSAELGLVAGRLKLSQIKDLEAINEVTSIEPDEEAQALGD